jgi:hypothetical protein
VLTDGRSDADWHREVGRVIAASGVAGVASPSIRELGSLRVELGAMTRRWRELAPGSTITEVFGV